MKTILKKYGILTIMSVLAVVLHFTACQQATGGTSKKTDDGANLKGQMFDSVQATFFNLSESVVPYTLKDKTVTFDFSAVKKVYAENNAESLFLIRVNSMIYFLESNLEDMPQDKKESARELITKYKDKITSKEQAIAFMEARNKLHGGSSSSHSGKQIYATMLQMHLHLHRCLKKAEVAM